MVRVILLAYFIIKKLNIQLNSEKGKKISGGTGHSS